MPKKPKIIDYITVRNDVPCQHCKNRRELFKEPTEDCKECGWLNRREAPYTSQIPVYEDVESTTLSN